MLFASFGVVMLLILILLRLLRPKEEDAFVLAVQMKAYDEKNFTKISYAAERLRLFGEDRCMQITVLCDELSAEEAKSLQNAFRAYPYVRFFGLEDEKTDLVEIK